MKGPESIPGATEANEAALSISERRAAALQELRKDLAPRCEAILETLKEDPTCERAGRVYEIESAAEMLMAENQRLQGELAQQAESAADSGDAAREEAARHALSIAENRVGLMASALSMLELYGDDPEGRACALEVVELIAPGFRDQLRTAEKHLEDMQGAA